MDDPTPGKQALQRLSTAAKDAAGRSCPGFNPLAQPDAMLFGSLMAGGHCLHGFTNRDIRARLATTRWLRSCADDPRKASAKVSRCFRRLHAHRLIVEIPRTRRWRVTHDGRQAMGTSLNLREHHFPNVCSGGVRRSSSQETKKSLRKNLSPEALNHTNRLEIFVCANHERAQSMLIARLDNLGKLLLEIRTGRGWRQDDRGSDPWAGDKNFWPGTTTKSP